MRSSKFLLFTVLVGVLAFGCSGTSETVRTAPGQNSNSTVPSGNGQTENSNNGGPNAEPIANYRNRGGLANEKMVDVNPSGTPVPPEFKPAAEDSESAVTMNSDGTALEIRVFRSHPQLARVEVTWLGPKDKDVKFYLRNGQILNIKTDRVPNLQTATTKELLEIAATGRK